MEESTISPRLGLNSFLMSIYGKFLDCLQFKIFIDCFIEEILNIFFSNLSQTKICQFFYTPRLSLLFEHKVEVHRPPPDYHSPGAEHSIIVCVLCLPRSPPTSFSQTQKIFPTRRSCGNNNKTWAHRIEFSYFPSRCKRKKKTAERRERVRRNKLAAQIMKKFTSNNKKREREGDEKP